MPSDVVHKEEWEDYVRDSSNMAGFIEYVEATDQIANKLENILNGSQSFSQLKDELTSFLQDRKDFVKYAGLHFP